MSDDWATQAATRGWDAPTVDEIRAYLATQPALEVRAVAADAITLAHRDLIEVGGTRYTAQKIVWPRADAPPPVPWCPGHGFQCAPTAAGCGLRELVARVFCACPVRHHDACPNRRRNGTGGRCACLDQHREDCRLTTFAPVAPRRAPRASAPAAEPAPAASVPPPLVLTKRPRGAPLPGQMRLPGTVRAD